MSQLAIPFNITLLVLNEQILRGVKPVRTLDIFQGMTKNFHEDGLFSQSIFGRIGDEQRNRRFSYIDIKIPIFHPVIFETFTKIKRLYSEIISSKAYAVFDPVIKDFVKSNQLDGQTGFHFFESHWKKIEFKENASDSRHLNIQLLKKYQNNCMLDKIVVLPAGLRDYEITSDGREAEDEINVLYRKLLSISNSISLNSFNQSRELFNTSRYSLQYTYNQLYELIKSSVEGKKKLYMGKWATRAIFNGTRNVATTNNYELRELDSDSNPSFNDVQIGLYQYLKATLPVSKYHIKNKYLSRVFVGPNAPANLIDKKTLKSVQKAVSPKIYDLWMSDEGLDKIISTYGIESVRLNTVEIEDHYLALIYIDEHSYRVFFDIDELPDSLDKSKVTPINFTQLLYLSVHEDSSNYPAMVTRYPITGYGSINPCMTFLRPTIKTAVKKQRNEQWEIDDNLPAAKQFPLGKAFYNSNSIGAARNKAMGLDFDGDTVSVIILYSQEAMKEVKDKLYKRSFYIDSSGKIAFSSATDTVNYCLRNITGQVNASLGVDQ